MRRVGFKCENCGNEVYVSVLGTEDSVIRAMRDIERKEDCCEDPSYQDGQGVLRRIRTSSVARMY